MAQDGKQHHQHLLLTINVFHACVTLNVVVAKTCGTALMPSTFGKDGLVCLKLKEGSIEASFLSSG